MPHLIAPPEPGAQALLHLPAPAKINVFLHIVGRRADGYHLLQSVFALVDWSDRISFFKRNSGVSRVDTNTSAALPTDDLLIQAARALQAATGCTQGVHMELDKHLPMQAGLGGGSSDAATCLIALNRLWGLGLSRSALLKIGATLGADVPFFVGGNNAWVQGVGEQLQPIVLPPSLITIVKPQSGVATAQLFQSPLLKRDTKPATMPDFAEHRVQQGDQSSELQPYAFGHNDLQAPAVAACPEIQDCLNWLRSKGLTPRMTGSGSAVFAAHDRPVDVYDARPDWVVRQSCVMDVHPLIAWSSDAVEASSDV
jgi:4-diphosphocytidyl-2-C-methyl-D-erythritol kinase